MATRDVAGPRPRPRRRPIELSDDFDVRWSIAVGDPAHEIIRAAEDLRCNLIVMGSRGLTGLDRIRLGSVARNVLQHASASVLIVREPIHERLEERAPLEPILAP